MIHVINKNTFDGEYKSKFIFPIDRMTPLGNPFTFNGIKSNLAKLSFATREEALEAYEEYFKASYGVNVELTKYFNEIYEAYKSGEDVYLVCHCKPSPCHGDFLEKQLTKKFILEKIKERKNQNKETIYNK